MVFGAVAPLLLALSAWLLYNAYTVDQAQGGTWGCEMSWMTPSYELIPTPGSPIPRYKLYLYREQGWDGEIDVGDFGLLLAAPEASSLQADAMPILFIPGNAGSFQQVRSIASSISRQYHGHPGAIARDMQHLRKPDVYTLDLNEDLSALHGGILRDQAHFLVHCIEQVLTRHRARQIILIGHSMGGIVARMASKMIDHNDRIELIITLSTPHALAPVTFDSSMQGAYRSIGHGDQPPIISICGGSADTQIASDACVVDLESQQSLSIFTTGMAGVWTGVDHQAIVWCHQLRSTIARTLLDLNQRDGAVSDPFQRAVWCLTKEQSPPTSAGMVTHSIQLNSPSTVLFTEKPQGVSLCQRGVCGEVDLLSEPIPLLTSGLPFPYPGEGVKTHDIGYMVSTNATGILEMSLHSHDAFAAGPHFTETVTGKQWYRKQNGTHFTLHFSSLSSSSLVAYRVKTILSACSGRAPLIRQSSLGSPRVLEQRFFGSTNPDIILHSHVGPAPFLRTSPSDIVLDVLQWPGCTVEQITIQSDTWRTYGKALLRVRMTFLAWTVGWSALLASFALREEKGDSRLNFRAVAAVLLVLTAGPVIQPWVPCGQHLILGSPGMWSMHLHLALAVITLLSALSLHAVIKGGRLLVSQSQQGGASNATTSRQSLMSALALAVLSGYFMPVELIKMVQLSFLIAKCVLKDVHPTLAWITVACLAMSPADIAPVAAWTRAILADRHKAPQTNQSIATVIPMMGLILFAGHRLALHRTRLFVLCRVALYFLTAVSFLLGPRYTFLVPWCLQLVMVMVCLVLEHA